MYENYDSSYKGCNQVESKVENFRFIMKIKIKRGRWLYYCQIKVLLEIKKRIIQNENYRGLVYEEVKLVVKLYILYRVLKY